MRWVGLVRNVMLGRDGLDRALLLDTVQRCGGARCRSYLTTGNVTFDVVPAGVDDLALRPETELSRIVDRPTMVAIRPHRWVRDLIRRDLFTGVDADAWECEVAFLRHTADPLEARSLPCARRTRVVAALDREVATARPRSGP